MYKTIFELKSESKFVITRKLFLQSLLVIISFTLFTNCSSIKVPLYEYPPDWQVVAQRDSAIDYFSKYLNGKKIYVDPGHGGIDRKNTNKGGDVIEADVNLRVAQYLKKYLNAAGTEVFLSRDKDTLIALDDRSKLSNNSGAEIFVSIHHNAPGKSEDNYSNYTSVYYHAKPTDYEYEPCDQDIAKYIERDLAYVMGNPGGLGSFDGTYSDYNIYPGQGFSVLRKKTIPGVLVECAFHTSHFEELRLNIEEFNQIQAWGIFRGLAKYFRAGKPEITFLPDSTKLINSSLSLSFALNDTSGINFKMCQIFFDKEEKDFSYDKVNNILSLKVDDVKPGFYPLKVVAINKNGNHSYPYRKQLIITESEIKLVD